MARRTYGQFCGLAEALDLVGERWTLLIVRDLSFGARRFSDLAEGLPGVSTALLTDRLRHLEAQRLVRRVFAPPPVEAVVYELTEDGESLFEALMPLAGWGLKRLDPEAEGRTGRAEWLALQFRQSFRPERAAGVRETYELRVGEDVFTLIVDDGDLRLVRGPVDDPDVVCETDFDTLMDLGLQRLRAPEAVKAKRMTTRGPRDAVERMHEIFLGPVAVRA